MSLNRTYTFVAAILLSLAAAFFIGRCKGLQDCDNMVIGTTTVIQRDTVTITKKEKLSWKNPNPSKATTIKYYPPQRNIDLNNPITPPVLYPQHIIIDSVGSTSGVGLSFKHIIENNDIVSSTYDIKYPSTRITESISTIKIVEKYKRSLYIGGSAYMSKLDPMRWDVIPTLTYKYEGAILQVGYGVRNESIHIGYHQRLW